MSVVEAFSQVAEDYDRWYEGNPLFESEVWAVRALGEALSPALEVGVGTGQFARALGLDFGLDPSLEMLKLAQKKGLRVICGLAEELPFQNASLASVYFLFTICFLSKPERALAESHRVLRDKGQLIVGFINRKSPLGEKYQEKAAQGHPLYRWAHFYRFEEIDALATRAGFSWKRAFSTLFGLKPQKQEPRPGVIEGAGFIVSLWEKESRF